MKPSFSPESLDFLITNRQNNSREWYHDHKDDYNRLVLQPAQALVEDLSDTMSRIDNRLELRPAVDKTISRIYRDTRFSNDKSLYRDTVWFTFRAAEKRRNNDYPAFFFEINPFSYRYGMGFFHGSAASMSLYRAAIDKKTKTFISIIKDLNKKGNFHPEGELYKRPLYKGRHEELRPWYDRKDIYLMKSSDTIEDIFDSEQLLTTLKEGFQEMAPFYRFLCEALT